MMLKRIGFVLTIALLLGSCDPKKKHGIGVVAGEQITVQGTAINAKGGAIVIGRSFKTYFIDGLDKWDEDLREKKVQVKGTLKVLSIAEGTYSKEEAVSDGAGGEKRIILEPKWKQIE